MFLCQTRQQFISKIKVARRFLCLIIFFYKRPKSSDLRSPKKALQPRESAPLYFHPNLAKHYERLVYDLRALLNKPDCKQEAVTALRKLINRIDLVPSEEGLSIDIVGNLAAMLQLTMPNMQKAAPEETAFAITLVAGA